MATIYQYAVKVVQGYIETPKKMPLGPGFYFTSVNIHNPWRKAIKLRYKIALAIPTFISKFKSVGLENDVVIEFDHNHFESMMIPPIPLFYEGYFVIESEAELDVVGVYTGNTYKEGLIGAMHMERVPARKIGIKE